MQNKYYFITYTVRTIGRDDWHYANALTDKYPLQWLIEIQDYTIKSVYVLVSYQEITEEQYHKYESLIG